MPFAREADGRISQRFFGAHTFRRTAFAGDYTGLEIQRTLLNRVRRLDVPIIDTMYVTRILTRDGVVFGAYGFDLEDGTRYVVHADAVVLAAGGHTRIWRRTSSRRDENTGDAFRLALTAGARIRDPELVQFHPSGLLEPERRRRHARVGGRPRRGRHPAQPARRAVHATLRPRPDGALHPGPGRPRRLHRDQGGPGHSATAACGSTSPTYPAKTIMQRLPRVYRTLHRAADARHHHDSDRDRADRPLLDGRGLGAPGGPRHRRSRACTPSARPPVGCTEPTGWAATR